MLTAAQALPKSRLRRLSISLLRLPNRRSLRARMSRRCVMHRIRRNAMPLRSVTITVGPPHSIAAFSAKRWSIRVATWTPASRRSRKRKPRRSTTSFANCGCSQASRCSTIGCGWGAFAMRAAERFGAGPWNHAELRATSRGAAAHQRIGTRGARRGRARLSRSRLGNSPVMQQPLTCRQ